MDNEVVGTKSLERLSHFNCGYCRKWFSIADAPSERNLWHCPWCGAQQAFGEVEEDDDDDEE